MYPWSAAAEQVRQGPAREKAAAKEADSGTAAGEETAGAGGQAAVRAAIGSSRTAGHRYASVAIIGADCYSAGIRQTRRPSASSRTPGSKVKR